MTRDALAWMGIGDGAMRRLEGYEGDIDGAAARLDGLDATKAELFKAIAYLALQANTYRAKSDLDSALFVSQVRSLIMGFDEAQKRKAQS
jgi:hypothetical protein